MRLRLAFRIEIRVRIEMRGRIEIRVRVPREGALAVIDVDGEHVEMVVARALVRFERDQPVLGSALDLTSQCARGADAVRVPCACACHARAVHKPCTWHHLT